VGVAPGEGERGPAAAPADPEAPAAAPADDPEAAPADPEAPAAASAAPEAAPERPHGELSTRSIWILGAVIGGFYAIGAIARGAVAAGLVGGVLATVLCFLVLREVRERRRRLERLRRGSR
jgi:hypothetical protein